MHLCVCVCMHHCAHREKDILWVLPSHLQNIGRERDCIETEGGGRSLLPAHLNLLGATQQTHLSAQSFPLLQRITLVALNTTWKM